MNKTTKLSIFFALLFLWLTFPTDKVQASVPDCSQGTTLNIVAHQDDDLLFLNPDIQNDIRSGRCVITVYLTAGDADQGPTYWDGRENGEKAAYSVMSVAANYWNQMDAGISGHPIPVFTLIGAPKTSLVFVRIPDGNYDGSGFSTNNFQSLEKLWQGNISTITTVDGSSTYTKQAVTNTLVSLMNKYQPDIIRTQNFVDSYNSAVDHSDHYSTAYFTKTASNEYSTSHILIGYYDYEINQRPQNIFDPDASEKRDTFIDYAQYDPLVCQTVAQCQQNAKYSGWFIRQYTVATITPSPAATPTPSATPSGNPTPTPTGSSFINIAPNGTGYRWSQLISETASTNQIAATAMNDGNTTFDISLNGGPSDNPNAYEGAGVIFSTGQSNITRVQYINGSWDTWLNGAFTANFQLQTSTDGTTWVKSGLNSIPSYNYDSSNSSGKTYIFNGALPDNIKGVRVVGQVRTNNSNSWVANAREIIIETDSVSGTPTPTVAPTPTPSPTPTNLINIAPNGTGYRWSQMNTPTLIANQTAATGMNDGNTSVNVSLNGGSSDKINAYEGAGVVFSTGQNNITRVQYINGTWDTWLNGAFTANFQLQTSIDGTTWTSTGFSPTPLYDYDSSRSSGKTYIFNGALPDNIKGVRVVGQVRTNNSNSWVANAREIIIETDSVSGTPLPSGTPTSSPTTTPTPSGTPIPTPAPSGTPISTPTPTPNPTATPGGSIELLNGTWVLSGSNGSAENNLGIGTPILSGKTSAMVKFDLHGAQFGTGDDEASVIFIQGGTWYAANLIKYSISGLNGEQTVTIPLFDFHKVGGTATLNLSGEVSDLHARFWNRNIFNVGLLSIKIQ